MMTKFPELKSTEVALVRADNNTGIVLDVDYKIYINVNQIKYSIFDSIESAITHINENKKTHKNMEFVIYDNFGNVVYRDVSYSE